jgi:hypothetical protein
MLIHFWLVHSAGAFVNKHKQVPGIAYMSALRLLMLLLLLQEHLTKLLRTLQTRHQEPLLVFSFSKCVHQ